MSKSERLQTKDERDEWLEEQEELGIFLDESDYYESGRPITLEGWKKLVEDLNELFENPPGNCETIEAVEIPEDPQVWKLEDVEDIREKMIEMCHDNSFDWGWYLPAWQGSEKDKDLLRFPFGREIIYEIQDQMRWCDCGTDTITLTENYPELGGCLDNGVPVNPAPTEDVESLIGGMSVGTVGYIGFWEYILVYHSTTRDAAREHRREVYEERFPDRDIGFWTINRRNIDAVSLRSGVVDCDGNIAYQPNAVASMPTAYLVNYDCYIDAEDDCVLSTTKPLWWFGPGWEEYNQEVYNQCLQAITDLRAAALQGATDELNHLNDEGTWEEYILRFTPGSPSEECEEE